MNIVTLAGKFKDIIELQEYCNAQYSTLNKSLDKIKQLEEEISHLRNLLGNTEVLAKPEIPELQVSAEQAICEIQINKLKEDATQRQLSLEEIKRLDLLVKNLYLSKGQPTNINKTDFTGAGYSEADLMKIAQSPEKNLDE